MFWLFPTDTVLLQVDQMLAQGFQALCIGAHVADAQPGRRAYLYQLLPGIEQLLNVVGESHGGRGDCQLHKIAGVLDDCPVWLLSKPGL
jgi:hypothetical protein